jgi:hypothetical protein
MEVLIILIVIVGHAIAQAVSSRLPTAAARIRARVGSGHVGFVVRKMALGLRVLQFPLRIRIPLIASQSSSSCGTGTVSQTVAAVPSELILIT